MIGNIGANKMPKQNKPKDGDLRVWWIPQVPGKPFYVFVEDIDEAGLIINTLAYYDLFQLQNNIKPDYSNVGGLEVFEDKKWSEWYSTDGEDIDEYAVNKE